MVAPSKLGQVFTYQSWVHAVSGAAGGVIAMSVFYPLDTIRSRLQIEESMKNYKKGNTLQILIQLIRKEGFTSLYRGLGPVLQSLCISNFVYFYTFHSLKALCAASRYSQYNVLRDLILGSLAGIINVLITTPFWVVNTRLKMQGVTGMGNEIDKHYKSLFAGLQYVAQTEGVRGLWSGTGASLMLVINPSFQFMLYEFLKRYYTKVRGEISGFPSFLMGATAKAFATLLTYPLQLVQAKQRHYSKNKGSFSKSKIDDMNTIKMMLQIIQSQGWKGLFRGLEAKIWQTVLTAALMFCIYEYIAKTVSNVLGR